MDNNDQFNFQVKKKLLLFGLILVVGIITILILSK